MSDGDTEGSIGLVCSYQNQSTRVSANGSNINTTRISDRNNNTLNSTVNTERPRYVESVYDRRSMYSRRNTSSTSFNSDSGIHSSRLYQSYYTDGMVSQESMYNRSSLPTSIGTKDSNLSAIDIALALKNEEFNESDAKIIQKAYKKYIKGSARKKIGRRPNIRMYLAGYRRVSGGSQGT